MQNTPIQFELLLHDNGQRQQQNSGWCLSLHLPENTTGYAYYFPIHGKSIDEFMCGVYNRQDQMCGRCKSSHAPPAYSYSLSCVHCNTSNWARYTAVSLLPLTAFFAFVTTFRVSATSPLLHGYILCVQLILCPNNIRTIRNPTPFLKFIITALNIWNLDFFRLVYQPFCLHPHTNTLHVLALDYIIAVYPLLLIALSYLLVLLYNHNVGAVVCLCRPFVALFIRFRQQWNIRSSLVDSFATFLLLSYVKILSVSVELILPVTLYDQSGEQLPHLYVYNQGDMAYFKGQHLPYACLALFFLLTFTLLPMLLLFLYPCSCFQVCLNRTGCSCQTLHIFMDTFQGHFKNGANGTRDLRYFSGFLLLLRVLVYVSLVGTYTTISFSYTTAILATSAVVVALFQPYKNKLYNIADTILLITTALLYTTLAPLTFMKPKRQRRGLTTINSILLAIIILYFPVIGGALLSKMIYNKCIKGHKWNLPRRGYERLEHM